jgi:hypothetical protein
MVQKKPKLYTMILNYLSDESLEAVQRTENWLEIETDLNPTAIER